MDNLIVSINRRLVNKCVDTRYMRNVQCWEFYPSMGLEELKELVTHQGYSFIPGKIDPWAEGNYTADEVNEANFLALDVDKDFKIDKALRNKFIQKHCFFAYTTVNHTPSEHKFRLLFKLCDSIRGSSNIKGAIDYLLKTYVPLADKSCVDPGRFFFGNNESEILIDNPDAEVLNIDFIKAAIAHGMEIEYANRRNRVDLAPENVDYGLINSALLPRDLELIYSQLSYIPPRTKGENTYLNCRDAFWCLCGALGKDAALFIMQEHSPSEGDWSLEKLADEYNPDKMPPSVCLAKLRSIASQCGWLEANSRQPNILRGKLSQRQQLQKLKIAQSVPVEEVALDRNEKVLLKEGVALDFTDLEVKEQVLEIAMNLISGYEELHNAGFRVEGDVDAWHKLVPEQFLAQAIAHLNECKVLGRSAVKDNEAWANTSNAIAHAERYLLKFIPKELEIVEENGYLLDTYPPDKKVSILAEKGETVERLAKKCLGAIFESKNPWHHIYRYGDGLQSFLCYPLSDGKNIRLKVMTDMVEVHSFLNDRIDYLKIVNKNVGKQVIEQPERQIEVDTRLLKYFMGSAKTNIPYLKGIRTIPAFSKRFDIVPIGYDTSTNFLYHYDDRDFKLDGLYSKQDARDALRFVGELIEEFQFESNSHRSAYFSYLLTCVTRNLYEIAPLFMITSGSSGSGKSYLSKIGATIADGVSTANRYIRDKEEFRKTLHSILSSERSVVILDNVNDEPAFTNEDLEALTTEGSVEIRVLGSTKAIRYPYVQTWVINGNNTAPYNDFVRRTIPIKIAKRADRNFKYPELVDRALSMRRELVRALLIIVLAYKQSGEVLKSEFDVAFRSWWDVACAPLVWMGELDPMKANQQCVDDDLYATEIDTWFDGIEELMGTGTWWSLADLLYAARNQNNGLDPLDWTPLWQTLREVSTSRSSNEISVKTLGRYFKSYIAHKQDTQCVRSFKAATLHRVASYSLVRH